MLTQKNLLLLSLVAIGFYLFIQFFYLSKPKQVIAPNINIQLKWHGTDLGCHSTFFPKKGDNAWFIEQLQFFLSEFEASTDGKNWHEVQLKQTAQQTAKVALLGGDCRSEETQKADESAWQVQLTDDLVIKNAKRLRFKLGVPFELNHLNPITQQSPLNLPSMFWVWQTGHKFLRLELASSDAQWLFHLGSTGCKSASVMRAPQQPCLYPNVFAFELAINSDDMLTGNSTTKIDLHLERLLRAVNIDVQQSCQSEQATASCQQLFTNLRNKEDKSQVFEFSSSNTQRVE